MQDDRLDHMITIIAQLKAIIFQTCWMSCDSILHKCLQGKYNNITYRHCIKTYASLYLQQFIFDVEGLMISTEEAGWHNKLPLKVTLGSETADGGRSHKMFSAAEGPAVFARLCKWAEVHLHRWGKRLGSLLSAEIKIKRISVVVKRGSLSRVIELPHSYWKSAA